MDLAKLDTVAAANTGSKLTLKHPVTGEDLYTEETPPQPMTITMRGTDSDAYQARVRATVNQRSKRRNKVPTIEEVEAEQIELVVAATVDWHLWMNGALLPFSVEEARDLYARLPWIKEQADAFTGERGNFLKHAPKT